MLGNVLGVYIFIGKICRTPAFIYGYSEKDSSYYMFISSPVLFFFFSVGLKCLKLFHFYPTSIKP